MELLWSVVDVFLHLDKHLGDVITQYGVGTYLILFLIVFCETGLVVTPFLPGDSLLFAAGTFAALGYLSPVVLIASLIVAAVLGDALNYRIGMWSGPKVLAGNRFIRREHIERTERFYVKYGGKTIIFARFVPIVRTFAPFLAGVGRMGYRRFAIFNITGGVLWITSFILAGYYFGTIEEVRKNFTLVILAIIVISILPAVFETLRARKESAAERQLA